MNALGVNKCDFWESETHRQIVSAGVVEVYEYGEYKRRKMCWHETDLYCVPSDDHPSSGFSFFKRTGSFKEGCPDKRYSNAFRRNKAI